MTFLGSKVAWAGIGRGTIHFYIAPTTVEQFSDLYQQKGMEAPLQRRLSENTEGVLFDVPMD